MQLFTAPVLERPVAAGQEPLLLRVLAWHAQIQVAQMLLMRFTVETRPVRRHVVGLVCHSKTSRLRIMGAPHLLETVSTYAMTRVVLIARIRVLVALAASRGAWYGSP